MVGIARAGWRQAQRGQDRHCGSTNYRWYETVIDHRRLGACHSLVYQNRRADYVNAVLDKLVNWDVAAENLGCWDGEGLMDFFVNKTRICRSLMHAFAFTIALLLTAAPNMALAKSGGGDDLRTAYSGIVQARPESGLHGEWVIGGRTFAADARTEFDQSEGKLVVGSCAKVQVRDGRVHEIDSGPMQDCQWGTCVAGRPVRHRQGTCQRFSGCSIYSL